MLGLKKAPLRFALFSDPLGNFSVGYPEGWKFDRDIPVMEGKYAVTFESKVAVFTIAVDAALRPGFDFDSYAKNQLESPASGIYANAKKTSFRGMKAYERSYSYDTGGRRHFRHEMMFASGRAVFWIAYGAPETERKQYERIFRRMLDSLVLLGKTKAIGMAF